MRANEFTTPRSRYRGDVKPENLMFNANLQEFAQKVSYISCLETNGKLSPEESYQQIKQLWGNLESSHHHLGIGKTA